MDSLRIVLGLGNPGRRYRDTRHNLGFRVVERLAEQHRTTFAERGRMFGTVSVSRLQGPRGPIVLAKPLTYMNRSGRAGRLLCEAFDVSPGSVLVVYDDVELELGRIRLRRAGSAGGHNGMRSLIDELQTDRIPRIRLGVAGLGRSRGPLSDYVLSEFDRAERPVADRLVALGAEASMAAVESGLTIAMNRYNARLAREETGDPDGPRRDPNEG